MPLESLLADRPRTTVAAAGTLSGVLLAASMLPLGVGPVAFVALVPLLVALDASPSPRHALLAGLCCGLALFALGFAWVPFTTPRRLSVTLVYVAYVPLLALPIAAYGGVLAGFRRFGRTAMLAVAAPVWVAIELARYGVELGSPWLHLGYALADHPDLIQLASLGGVHLVSAWVAAANASLAAVACTGRLALPTLASGLPLLAPFACAAWPDAPPGSRDVQTPPGSAVRVAAVQPDIAGHDRHVPERFDDNLRALLALSEPIAATAPDLIVWPESAFELSVASPSHAFLGAIGHHLGAPLVTGVWRKAAPDAAWAAPDAAWLYNSAVFVGAGTSVRVADKRHPVPLYERAPGSDLARRLAASGLWPGRFAAGGPGDVLDLPRAGAGPVGLGVLVCIDASYPEVARDLRRRGAEVLVTLANEADTGEVTARLQAQTARLRAVENRVPVVRVANTGPSEWIDADGRVVSLLVAGRAAAATAAVRVGRPPSFYTQIGDGPLTALVFTIPGVVALAGVARAKRRAASAAATHERHEREERGA